MAYLVAVKDKDEYNLEKRELRKKLDKSIANKQTQTRMWDMCVHYLEGRQHLVWNKGLRSFDVDRRGGSINKVTINLLLNIYRNLASRLTVAYPGIVVLPASPSHDDIVKAKASETAIQYYWNEQNLADKFKIMAEWLVSTGNAFFHTFYDPDKEQVITKVISPYDVFYEAGVTSEEESEFCSIRHYYRKQELYDTYPDKREIIENAVESGETAQGNDAYGGPNVPSGRVIVYETYFKDGKYCIHIGDSILFAGRTPMGTMPIQHIKFTDIPNRLWGLGLILPLIELQSLYNRARTQIIQNIELMGNPKWLIPKTSGVNPNAITNRAGEKVFYNPAGGAPQQVPASPIPAHVVQNVQQIHSEMLDVSGVHSISLGKRAKGITSGKAMNALAEQDSSQLHITQHNIEMAAKGVAETALIFMKAYYTEPKMVRMLDVMGKVVFDSITRESIVDDPEIFIEAGTMFRNEAQDKDQKILDLLERQLIPPEVALKELSFRTGNSYVLDVMADEAHANEILQGIISGAQVEIFKTDNLQRFQKVFGDFIRTGVYYDLPMDTQDYIRDVFIAIEAGIQGGQAIQEYSKIYPPQPPPDAQLREQTVLMNSNDGQEQMLQEYVQQKAREGTVKEASALGQIQNASEEMGIETALPGGE